MSGGQYFIVWTFFVITTSAVASSEYKKGWYIFTGPDSFYPNSKYVCTVTLFPDFGFIPTDVSVSIKIPGSVLAKHAVVKPLVTTTFDLEIPNISSGMFYLDIKGKGGLEFDLRYYLQFKTKSKSAVFIQIDRAVYKPGSKVQFRILTLDPYLKPIFISGAKVQIIDGDGNKVKEWREMVTEKGVWSGEMQLSDYPVLGNWTIQVLLRDDTITKNFEVAEYVLPKFDISLNVPQHALSTNAKIAATINAKYTYGGAVKGEATVTARLPNFQKAVSKVVAVNGEAVVGFSLVDELDISPSFDGEVSFEVIVEESLTGRKQSTESSVSFHVHKYKMELIKKSNYFKPGLKYNAYLKAAQYDDTPISDKSEPVRVYFTYHLDNGSYLSGDTSYEIPASCLIELTFYPPENATHLTIKSVYDKMTYAHPSVKRSALRSNKFIDVTVLSKHPQVDSYIKVDVNMTEHSPLVIYQIQGRDGIIFADSVPIEEGKTTASFQFMATPLMAPKVKLIAYYVCIEDKMAVDSVDIYIDYSLSNYVGLKSNITETEPGQGIELNLRSKPNSYIGLLGLDTSVLLLRKGNDISKTEVMNKLNSFNTAFDPKIFFVYSNPQRAESFFRNVGLIFGSNVRDYSPPMHAAPIFNKLKQPPRYDGAMTAQLAPVQTPPSPKPRLRSNFPETWIWKGVETDGEGKATLSETVPDTITSWVISAFSVDSAHGLGLLDQPAKIKVFRPFFLSLDLPYSIIRGETVTIPVALFNYMDTEVTADVTLLNLAGQFEFEDDTNSLSEKQEKVQFKKERVTVKPNSGERTSFTITATELGYISIKVTAKSDLAGDAVERKLLVKAGGETQYMNQAIFVDLRKENSLEETVAINLPDYFVPGSAWTEVSAVGALLGTSLDNLEKLVQMPSGCGEQNMLNFVPNIVVLEYLKSSDQLTPSIENKCLKFMASGYQQELTYKHEDGSFSAFGRRDSSGSTWLTAYVLNSFASAESYMDIDADVISNGLIWLAVHQLPNGTFPEVGSVFYKDMQGGSGQGLALTSFSLLPFLAYNKSEHTSTVERALEYIAKQLDNIKNDSYSLAISTYVLHLAQHPAKDAAFLLLQSNSHTAHSKKWWKRAEKKSDTENPHAMKPNSVDVEMTAYAMLTYLERGLVEDSLPIMSWLMSQQNSDGGFASTQDTVVALTVLSKFARMVEEKNRDMSVAFSTDDGFSKSLDINSDNSLILQKLEVPGDADKVNIKAEGHGIAIVQVSYRYNVDKTGSWPKFNLQPIARNSSDPNQLLLDICSSFIKGKDEDESSNMVVMEVTLPSGYAVDQDYLPSLQTSQNVKRVELKEADTHVVLYFDKMTKEEICPSITAVKTHNVKKPKAVPVTVYDYYDQSRRARVFYTPPNA